MADEYRESKSNAFSIGHFIIRFVLGAVVLAVTAFLTPGFSISNIWALALGALVLAILDYAASSLLGKDASPFGRGITGFILAAVIIYLTQFIVRGFNVTILGAIIGALIYGVVDALIPGKSTM